MKKFYSILSLALSLGTYQIANSQTYGPNLLGAKGTFSAPFITVNSSAAGCTSDGTKSYSPVGNIGNALSSYAGTGTSIPSSGYPYVSAKGGLGPEFTYTLIKNIGDANGFNCIKGDWRAQDHTGGDSYFMAVNGAPDKNKSGVFYEIKSIPVCPGTKYEFSAYVINILPKTSSAALPGSEPSISFKVKGGLVTTTIANSGAIAYNNIPVWVKVSGTYTAPSDVSSVDLQVVNATSVASGNDLGLDDISFSVVESNIAVTGLNGGAATGATCEGTSFGVNFTVTDPSHTNTWYKWQKSIDGVHFVDSSAGAQTATYTGDIFTLPLAFNNVSSDMSGYKYRLVVSTSEEGLKNAVCTFVNEYTLLINACAIMPVTLTSFNGRYSNSAAYLDWQTSQEINSDHFELLKSTDGQNFSLVSSIKSAGNSNTVKNYSYTDYTPGNSQYVYYRLKQVDINGKFAFSSIVKISLGAKMGIEVFPNPFVSNFTASFSAAKTAEASVVLRNSIGQPVFKQIVKVNKGNNSVVINNLPALTTGVYYLSISNDDINYVNKLQKK
jgi:hypothetical protein